MPKRNRTIETIHGTLELSGRDLTLTYLCVSHGPVLWYGSNDMVKAHAYASKHNLVVVFNTLKGHSPNG